MEKSYIFTAIAFILILLAVSGQEGCELGPEDEIECILSLCDCECHPKGQTPEELKGVLCGINCYGLHNITGCEYVNGSCQFVYENQTSQQQENNPVDGLTGSAQSSPESESDCGCGH